MNACMLTFPHLLTALWGNTVSFALHIILPIMLWLWVLPFCTSPYYAGKPAQQEESWSFWSAVRRLMNRAAICIAGTVLPWREVLKLNACLLTYPQLLRAPRGDTVSLSSQTLLPTMLRVWVLSFCINPYDAGKPPQQEECLSFSNAVKRLMSKAAICIAGTVLPWREVLKLKGCPLTYPQLLKVLWGDTV